MLDADKDVVRDVLRVTIESDDELLLRLMPGTYVLFYLFLERNPSLDFSPVSEEADCFRRMLNLLHKAALMKCGPADGLESAYEVAVRKQMDSYFLRVMMLKLTHAKPSKPRLLNYQARKMVLLIIRRGTSPSIWKNLETECSDVLKHVTSFL
jgi:hypothetical protein